MVNSLGGVGVVVVVLVVVAVVEIVVVVVAKLFGPKRNQMIWNGHKHKTVTK